MTINHRSIKSQKYIYARTELLEFENLQLRVRLPSDRGSIWPTLHPQYPLPMQPILWTESAPSEPKHEGSASLKVHPRLQESTSFECSPHLTHLLIYWGLGDPPLRISPTGETLAADIHVKLMWSLHNSSKSVYLIRMNLTVRLKLYEINKL